MSKKAIQHLTVQAVDYLLLQGLPYASERRTALLLLRQSGFSEGVAQLFPITQRLTCQQVLTLCQPIVEKLSPPPEDGWISFCYRYLRHRLYPDGNFAPDQAPHRAGADFFLLVLQNLMEQERRELAFDPLYDFAFLTPEELELSDCQEEYVHFLERFHQDLIYELMRLGQEATPFRTLGHIAGVHHVAMTVARGLRQAGVEVDLSLISGAAAAHDIGKFGCRPGERVPYLHYYYTDQWLLSHGLEQISHIASNHSTWDLELESLSVESLCLIYADFRSKQDRDEQGREITVIYPLDQSFQVILSKLDHVDSEKRRRYELVYGRLHDFEDYMRALGVDVELTGHPKPPHPQKDPALMTPEETIQGLTLLSVEHNIRIMHLLSNERKFGNLIESARSTKDWKELRAYLNIFEAYFTYLSARQKTQALTFLYELLVHREGDIRRHAAALMGQIIARFHLVYRKEIPEHAESDPAEEVPFTLWQEYLEILIYPDHKTTQQQRAHISYTLKLILASLLEYARPSDAPRFLEALFQYYHHPEEKDVDTAFTLLDAARYLPSQSYDSVMRSGLLDFAQHWAVCQDERLEAVTLLLLREATRTLSKEHPHVERIVQIAQSIHSKSLPIIFLQYRILKRAGRDVSAQKQILYQQDITAEIFLDNLKTATPWIIKAMGVELLRDQVEYGLRDHILHIATHFSNLVKVSERVVVRYSAGNALVRILPLLRRDQRNEVVVELGKGLEMGQYAISKYIPRYLGQSALFLHPSELDEQILWLKHLMASPNDSAVSGALNTIGIILQHYPSYQARFSEPDRIYEHRREVLLGLVLQGLAHYRPAVRQEALLVVGNMLFESPILPVEEKSRLFGLTYHKLLFLIQEAPEQDALTLFHRAAALTHINHFIARRRVERGPFLFPQSRKVAFFPGTFDPFTLSHKGIVHAIRDMGFEVYLAIDEFSWSKKAQPHMIRRQIVNLSIAGEFHVHLFPSHIPINIANPEDLKGLQEMFPSQSVYLVVGSDVVAHASSYQNPPQPWSVHSMNHIIFRRPEDAPLAQTAQLPITGEVLQLQLPAHLEDISSTRIRENVDLNRDISNLIDPVIQDFIYQNGIYLRDSQEMPLLGGNLQLHFDWLEAPQQTMVQALTAHLPDGEELCQEICQHQDSMLTLRHGEDGALIGLLTFRYLSASQLFGVVHDPDLADRIRLRAAGTTLLITSALEHPDHSRYGVLQLLLTEVLAKALKEDCIYGLYHPYRSMWDGEMADLLARQGFIQQEERLLLWEVDMSAPTVLLQNLEATIQDPLCTSTRVMDAVEQGHRRLQTALTRLYPGSLVLTLSARVLHQRMLQMITQYNQVPSTPTNPRTLGKYMCVPYGKMLRGKVVPNTVTKTIHTDRVYIPDLTESHMEPFPYYAPIESQIRTIKSFGRPVILVDDLIHAGFRIRALEPLLEQEQIDVRMVVVGLLSGYGRDLMESFGQAVDSVYYLPRLQEWFVESTLYPFIGGNTVRRTTPPVPGLLSGINHILPYAKPILHGDSNPTSVLELSRCCLESARDLMLALEQEYRSLYGRNLTLSRLPEAIILPLCPDKGTCVAYDPTLAPSVYLENDLEQLLRTHGM